MPSPSILALYAVAAVIVLLASALTYSLVKYLGAAYLVYLGVRKLLGRAGPHAIQAAVQPRSAARLFYQGMLVNVLDPKLALFFVAFLPQFVDRSRGAVNGAEAPRALGFRRPR